MNARRVLSAEAVELGGINGWLKETEDSAIGRVARPRARLRCGDEEKSEINGGKDERTERR